MFLRFNVFDDFLIISTYIFFIKQLSNAKYEYAKLQRKILLNDALAMIFIDFGLLRSPHCKISYFLAVLRYVLKFDNKNLTDNSWIHGKCR